MGLKGHDGHDGGANTVCEYLAELDSQRASAEKADRDRRAAAAHASNCFKRFEAEWHRLKMPGALTYEPMYPNNCTVVVESWGRPIFVRFPHEGDDCISSLDDGFGLDADGQLEVLRRLHVLPLPLYDEDDEEDEEDGSEREREASESMGSMDEHEGDGSDGSEHLPVVPVGYRSWSSSRRQACGPSGLRGVLARLFFRGFLWLGGTVEHAPPLPPRSAG